jgi:hypothetical protein
MVVYLSPAYNENGQETIEMVSHIVPARMDQRSLSSASSADRLCLAITSYLHLTNNGIIGMCE